jgi:hypothetical protein
MRPYPRFGERAALPPIWSCSGWGLACARDHSRAGGLLPRLFTLTLAGGIFSVPLSADRSAPSLAATLPYGARTFLPVKRGDRPTHSGRRDSSTGATLRTSSPWCTRGEACQSRLGSSRWRKYRSSAIRRASVNLRSKGFAGSWGRSRSGNGAGFRCRAAVAAASGIPGRFRLWLRRPPARYAG